METGTCGLPDLTHGAAVLSFCLRSELVALGQQCRLSLVLGASSALVRALAVNPESAPRPCRVVAVQLTPKALTLLEHNTTSPVLPNVRANAD